MFKKNIKKTIKIRNRCVWYRIKVKILNLTKNNPKGGNPVKVKMRKNIKFFTGIYF